MRGVSTRMAIRINSSFFKLWGIRRCSGRIAKIVSHADRPAVLYPTSKGLKLVPLNSENAIDIGFKKLSSQLMRPLDVSKESEDISTFKGQILQINPCITGGQLKQCLRSLIKKGLYDSGELLKKNGISLRPEIKTTEDLANYLSDRLKNKLFGIMGSADAIRGFAINIEAKLNAIKAAKLLGKDIKGILGSILEDIKALDSLSLLETYCAEYQAIVDGLAVFPYVKRTGNSEQEKLTIKELTAYILGQLKIDPVETTDKISEIRTLIENTERSGISINDSNAETKIDNLLEAIAYLKTLLAPVQRSGSKSMQTINDLVALAISHHDGPITEDLLNKSFKIKDDPEDKVTGWPNTLPQITKETASKINVLIVDDEPGVRLFLERSFKDLGFRVTTAANGELGLETVKKGGFDIVYSDFTMPGMDGVDFLGVLRQNNKDIPAYIISASPPELAPKKISEFINAGNAKYIVKDIANMSRILRPAIETAEIKTGISVNRSATGPSMPDMPKKRTDLQIFIVRLTHKLNNIITGLMGYGDLLARHMNNAEYLNALRETFEACRLTTESLRGYTKEFYQRPKGDIELLPKELKYDKDFTAAMERLSADESEYNKIGATTAAIAVRYASILGTISTHLDSFEKNRDKNSIDKINLLARKLRVINNSLVMGPESEGMEIVSKIIESILKEK